ncbi:MAG: FkbM family methyltransferase [Rhodobacterales bacterium]|nr:FkbM family methyltransferase [Rhodobacterales bacterium]
MDGSIQDTATGAPGRKFIKSRGMKFPKNSDFITGPIRGALRAGNYEQRETETVLKVVQKDDVVIELGAGIGYMSTLVATKRQVKSVHAFEANPHLISYIKDVHKANDVENVTVTNAILGPRKGQVDFFVRKNFIGSSMQEVKGTNVVSVEKIEVLNANSVFKKIKPTVLICDIEGAEADLFPALDLTGLRAAIVELHPQWIGQKGVQAVFDAMHKAGLTYWPRGSDAKVVTFRNDW